MFDELGAAILTFRQLHFTYTEKKRTVNPYKLINTNGIWYLLADDGGVLKTFSLSKIESLTISSDTFEPDPECVEQVRNNDAKWFSDKRIEVVLEIDKSVADYFLKRKLFPNQTIMQKTAKKLVLSTIAAYEEEILRTVRYWIPHITIRSPEYLSQKLHAELSEYMKKFQYS